MLMRIRSAYLREEEKYDRWGAMGKVLATLEVLRAEGVDPAGVRLETIVNAAFPRTFSCQRVPREGEPVPGREELLAEVAGIARLLRESGIAGLSADRLAIEEVAERRCLDAAFLRRHLQ